MKIERKKGIDKIKITHNSKLFWIILLLLLLLLILIFIFIKAGEKKNEIEKECLDPSDCVPATCCHPSSCTSISKKPICNGTLCSQDCESILDCGNAYCGCINGKCDVIKK